jgi:cyclopropane-fatty-acyl-phospholipid synthase
MWYMRKVERDFVLDWLIRWGIRWQVRTNLVRDEHLDIAERHVTKLALIEKFRLSPIAVHADAANTQHYELPPEFFQLVLGKQLKYSACYWPDGVGALDEAEEALLQLTCERFSLPKNLECVAEET